MEPNWVGEWGILGWEWAVQTSPDCSSPHPTLPSPAHAACQCFQPPKRLQGIFPSRACWFLPHLLMLFIPLSLPSHLHPPRSACTSCRTSPPPTSCISFLSISAVRRASRTRRAGTRPACAHDPGASGGAALSWQGAPRTMHWVLAHPGHPLPSHQLFLGVLVLLSLAQTLS